MRRSTRCMINSIGRIVIPSPIRKQLKIDQDSPVEIAVHNEVITIRKYSESCVFCKSSKNLTSFKQHRICKSCLREIGSRRNVATIG